MGNRLLLDGVHVTSDEATVNKQFEPAVDILPYPAQADLA
jgi:hypothetical protein